MGYTKGIFGVLNLEALTDEPFLLLDGGIESRFQEIYDYDNSCRSEYTGYVFQCTLSGCGVYEANGQSFLLPAGTAFFTAIPQKSRYFLPRDSSSPWEFIYIHFSGSGVLPFFLRFQTLCGAVCHPGTESPAIHKLISLQKRILRGGRLQPYEGGELIYSFLCSLLREISRPGSANTNAPAGLAAAIMDADYAALSGISEVAERLKLSPEHLSRSFQKQWGISPVRYLNRLRVQAAVNELLSTADPIDAIALRCGFSSGNYFCKVFSRYVGMSPGEYRRKRSGC